MVDTCSWPHVLPHVGIGFADRHVCAPANDSTCRMPLMLAMAAVYHVSEVGMVRLDTLIELKFLNSSFSSSNCSIRAFRAYPLIDIKLTVPYRPVEQFEATLSQSTVPSPPLQWSPLGGFVLRPRRTIARGPSLSDCQQPKSLFNGRYIYIYIYIYIISICM